MDTSSTDGTGTDHAILDTMGSSTSDSSSLDMTSRGGTLLRDSISPHTSRVHGHGYTSDVVEKERIKHQASVYSPYHDHTWP